MRWNIYHLCASGLLFRSDFNKLTSSMKLTYILNKIQIFWVFYTVITLKTRSIIFSSVYGIASKTPFTVDLWLTTMAFRLEIFLDWKSTLWNSELNSTCIGPIYPSARFHSADDDESFTAAELSFWNCRSSTKLLTSKPSGFEFHTYG